MTPAQFRARVWRYYLTHGRHTLPWRKTHDLYRLLVSEVMLQQTQVDRVIPFYHQFLQQFPTAKRLAAAPLSQVLTFWQGLGYNRRAKMLREAARSLTTKPPTTATELEQLPGVGPYTARALAAFAFNQDGAVIETNIRTAIIHHFFPTKRIVSDAEIEQILLTVSPKGKAREWYSALMDYGAHLKRLGISYNARSAHYVKQKPLKGSMREARGALVREFTKGTTSRSQLCNLFGPSRKIQMEKALDALRKEGLLT